ncbi:MAG: hypothetical protein J3R72DRAFT_48022 [Linnemannia gamsii]|nr:MAG: hypothetical protein J3R72DRAFT_48022 [Linnemannia gamsii]
MKSVDLTPIHNRNIFSLSSSFQWYHLKANFTYPPLLVLFSSRLCSSFFTQLSTYRSSVHSPFESLLRNETKKRQRNTLRPFVCPLFSFSLSKSTILSTRPSPFTPPPPLFTSPHETTTPSLSLSRSHNPPASRFNFFHCYCYFALPSFLPSFFLTPSNDRPTDLTELFLFFPIPHHILVNKEALSSLFFCCLYILCPPSSLSLYFPPSFPFSAYPQHCSNYNNNGKLPFTV